MRRVGREAAATLLVMVSAALLVLSVGTVPSRAVSPLPSLDLSSPLPSLDLSSPLPSLDLSSPLPSLDLSSPLPSLDLSSPLPSLDLSSPLPSLAPESASPRTSPSATRSPQATAPPGGGSPSVSPISSVPVDVLQPIPDGSSPAQGATTSRDAPVSGQPSVAELTPLLPTLPNAGSWLIPVVGVAVPALIVALIVVAQLVGGAAGLGLARAALERVNAVAPAWMRS